MHFLIHPSECHRPTPMWHSAVGENVVARLVARSLRVEVAAARLGEIELRQAKGANPMCAKTGALGALELLPSGQVQIPSITFP